MARPLHDLHAVVVDPGRRHQAPCDTPDPGAEVLRTLGQRPASRAGGGPQLFAPRRHRRHPPIRGIDHHGDLLRRGRLHVAERRVTPLRLVAPDAAQRTALSPCRRLLGCQHLDVGDVVGPLERDTVRGIAGPDPLEVRCAPRGPRHRVRLQVGRDVRDSHLGDYTRKPGLDEREADVVRTADQRPPRGGAAALGHRRPFQELDAVPTHLGGGRIEVLHSEGNVVDRASGGCRGRAVFVAHREQPNVAEQDAIQTVPQPGALATEHLPIPRQRRRGVGRAEMNVMEPEGVGVLYQLDPRPPRVEDEADLEQPRHVPQRRAVFEPLQPDPRSSDANGLELGHLGRQVGIGEGNVVDAGALAGAQRRA